ncbi:AraC family transcriptional regulator [Rhodococcus sp. WS4]|nr:AraC family transcriptional regulator [Rhodococcus sp. WS4]
MTLVTVSGLGGWARMISDTFIELGVKEADASFQGALDQRELGRGVSLTRVETDPSHVLRTPRLTRDGCDDVLFLMHVSGEGAVLKDGQLTRMPSGYGSLHAASDPYELKFATASREVVLQTPRRLLPSREFELLHRGPTGIPPQDPAMRVLWSFTQELLTVSNDLPTPLREEMGQTAVDLLLSVLHHRDLEESAKAVGPEAIYQSMKRLIRENAPDPAFTVELAAQQHNISLRYAQTLFTRSGMSPAAFLRSERIANAQRLLADPRQSGIPVESVAYRSGFVDVNTFIRAFKRAVGVTPGVWRASVHEPR